MAKKKTHCIRGHEFTKENTQIVFEDGYEKKKCRTCHKLRMRKYQGYTGKGDPRKFLKKCSRGHHFTKKNTYIQIQNGIKTRKCRVCRLLIQRRWYKNNRKKYNKRCRTYWKTWIVKTRKEVLTHYGNGKLACVCCHEDTYQFLTLDHVYNNGQKERKKYGSNNNIISMLRTKGYPEGYQTLCWNCNLGKRSNKGTCPHKTQKTIPIELRSYTYTKHK